LSPHFESPCLRAEVLVILVRLASFVVEVMDGEFGRLGDALASPLIALSLLLVFLIGLATQNRFRIGGSG
jgi:hypothetical protein